MTIPAGFGMQASLADALALPIHGRGRRRRRLGWLPGLAEAAAAIPGHAKPAANGGLLQRWHGPQGKDSDHRGHQ